MDPGWSARVLGRLDSVRPFEQELQRGRTRPESSARRGKLGHPRMFHRRFGSSRFTRRNRGYFKRCSFRGALAMAVAERQTKQGNKQECFCHVFEYTAPGLPSPFRNAKLRQEP